MFGIFFKSSWKALPFIALLPLLVCVLYITVIDPYGGILISGMGSEAVSDHQWEFQESEKTFFGFNDHLGFQSIKRSMILAMVVNLILLMIIPCAFGGTVSGKKRAQFYLGFFINLAICLGFPIYFNTIFVLDASTLFMLIALHLAGFMLPFILGALFVAPAYKMAFWFINRR
ncbi:MAG: hypothetical protein LBT01_03360 [Spirochaetaceae bacterium]|jgi:hypothetical protein|nr:hypothetical protein [Spirochaetaceae bacterium]